MTETPTYELKNERETFLKVADILENFTRALPIGFNMNIGCSSGLDEASVDNTGEAYSCGTVACIGGHAYLLENPGDFAGASRYVANQNSHAPIDRLFYPRCDDYNVITPALASIAIHKYLDGERYFWDHIDGFNQDDDEYAIERYAKLDLKDQ